MIETYTPSQATDYLQDRADYFTNENYHTEASAVYDALEEIGSIGERTLVVISLGDEGTDKFWVVP